MAFEVKATLYIKKVFTTFKVANTKYTFFLNSNNITCLVSYTAAVVTFLLSKSLKVGVISKKASTNNGSK